MSLFWQAFNQWLSEHAVTSEAHKASSLLSSILDSHVFLWKKRTTGVTTDNFGAMLI